MAVTHSYVWHSRHLQMITASVFCKTVPAVSLVHEIGFCNSKEISALHCWTTYTSFCHNWLLFSIAGACRRSYPTPPHTATSTVQRSWGCPSTCSSPCLGAQPKYVLLAVGPMHGTQFCCKVINMVACFCTIICSLMCAKFRAVDGLARKRSCSVACC